jgi:hypothetical protein
VQNERRLSDHRRHVHDLLDNDEVRRASLLAG